MTVLNPSTENGSEQEVGSGASFAKRTPAYELGAGRGHKRAGSQAGLDAGLDAELDAGLEQNGLEDAVQQMNGDVNGPEQGYAACPQCLQFIAPASAPRHLFKCMGSASDNA